MTEKLAEISEKDLQDYFGDNTAKGRVYLDGETPFLQLHKFADVYTLFWRSKPEDKILRDLTPKLHEEVIRNQNAHFEELPISIRFAVLETVRNSGKMERLTGVRKYYKVDRLKPESFGKKIGTFLDKNLSAAVSLLTRLSVDPASPYQPHILSFWTGTKRFSNKNIETGLMVAYGPCLPRESLRELLSKTSPFFGKIGETATESFVEKLIAEQGLNVRFTRG